MDSLAKQKINAENNVAEKIEGLAVKVEKLNTTIGKVANIIMPISLREVDMDRRNDMGMKIGYFVLTATISLLLGIFLKITFDRAEAADEKSNENNAALCTLQSRIDEGLPEIKRRLSMIDNKLDSLFTAIVQNNGNNKLKK